MVKRGILLGAVFVWMTLGSISAAHGASGPEGAGPRGLKRVTDLPGWGVTVGQAERDLLSKATLKLGRSEADRNIRPGCSATKIAFADGFVAGLTAAHCFSELTGNRPGLLRPRDQAYPYPATLEARNLLGPGVRTRYLAFDPQHDSPLWKRPVARITGIAVLPDVDLALLRFEPAGESAQRWREIPAVPFKLAVRSPLVGQTVALSSVPDSVLTAGTGLYVGRIRVADASWGFGFGERPFSLDVVAHSPRTSSEDATYFGASGSAAIFSGGQLLPGLARRVSVGYGNRSPASSQDPRWADLEHALGVYLPRSRFNVLALYSDPTESMMEKLRRGFEKPFGMYANGDLNRDGYGEHVRVFDSDLPRSVAARVVIRDGRTAELLYSRPLRWRTAATGARCTEGLDVQIGRMSNARSNDVLIVGRGGSQRCYQIIHVTRGRAEVVFDYAPLPWHEGDRASWMPPPLQRGDPVTPSGQGFRWASPSGVRPAKPRLDSFSIKERQLQRCTPCAWVGTWVRNVTYRYSAAARRFLPINWSVSFEYI